MKQNTYRHDNSLETKLVVNKEFKQKNACEDRHPNLTKHFILTLSLQIPVALLR